MMDKRLAKLKQLAETKLRNTATPQGVATADETTTRKEIKFSQGHLAGFRRNMTGEYQLTLDKDIEEAWRTRSF